MQMMYSGLTLTNPGMTSPNPPLASMYCPVIQPESGEASSATALAISSTLPTRPRAVIAEKVRSTLGSARIPAFMSVAVRPGARVLTVIPRLPSSAASPTVKLLIAALVMQ